MSGPALAVHQFRYDQKAFWRNPARSSSRSRSR